MTLKVWGVDRGDFSRAVDGKGSTIEGPGCDAFGTYSHAEGVNSHASGTNCHAEGSSTSSGVYSHAEGGSTTASGNYSHSEGQSTNASGSSAHAEGFLSAASAGESHAEGRSTLASGSSSHAEGNGGTASGSGSHCEGYDSVAFRRAQYSKGSAMFGVAGDSQINNFVAGRVSSSATAVTLTFDRNSSVVLSGNSTTVLTIPNSCAHTFRIEAVARRTDVQGEMAGWNIIGLVGRDSSGSARIIGSPVVVTWADAAASSWTLAVSIDTTDSTYNYLKLLATGEAAKTIRWVAGIYTTEVNG